MPTPASNAGVPQELFSGNIVFPSGEELYDSIMGEIEPELVLSNLATVDAPYGTESAKEKKSRYERYGKAFAEYKRRYEIFMKNLTEALSVYKRTVMQVAQQVTSKKESAVLRALEIQLSAL